MMHSISYTPEKDYFNIGAVVVVVFQTNESGRHMTWMGGRRDEHANDVRYVNELTVQYAIGCHCECECECECTDGPCVLCCS